MRIKKTALDLYAEGGEEMIEFCKMMECLQLTAFQIRQHDEDKSFRNFQLGCCKYNPDHPQFAEMREKGMF